jgi:hypothetical protein
VSWKRVRGLRSWEDNSKLHLGKLGCEDVKYFDVTWDEVTQNTVHPTNQIFQDPVYYYHPHSFSVLSAGSFPRH